MLAVLQEGQALYLSQARKAKRACTWVCKLLLVSEEGRAR